MLPPRAAKTDRKMGFAFRQMRWQHKQHEIEDFFRELIKTRIGRDESLN